MSLSCVVQSVQFYMVRSPPPQKKKSTPNPFDREEPHLYMFLIHRHHFVEKPPVESVTKCCLFSQATVF